MGWIAAAAAGGSIVSGIAAGGAAGHAADVQSQASQYAANIQGQMYNQTRNDLNPFVRAGTGGLNNLNSLVAGGINLSDYRPSTLTVGGSQAGAQDPSNLQYLTVPGPDGEPSQIPNPSYDPSKAAASQFQLGGPGGDSKFLTGLQSYLYGQGRNPALTSLMGLAPGAGGPGTDPTIPRDPLQDAVRGFVPGSGVAPNSMLQGVMNFIPGASGTPDASLTALRSYVPGGGTENQLLKQYQALLGVGGDPASVQASLESTPGYQFVRDQGLKSTQNSFAAKGLGNSGAAMRGAADYTTGLANSTYEQRLADYMNSYNSQFTNTYNAYNSQFSNNLNAYNTGFANTSNAYGQAFNNALNNYNSQFTNSYNAYGQQLNAAENVVSMGQNAAAQTGTIGQGTSQAIGNTLTSGAAAQAAGIVGGANALTNSISGVTGALTGAMLLPQGLATPGLSSAKNAATVLGMYNKP